MATSLINVGQDNGSGDIDALFRQLWSGEILAAYKKALVTEGRMEVRQVNGAKSWDYPAIGIAAAGYHTRETELAGQNIIRADLRVFLDDIITSQFSIYDLDVVKQDFDARSVYTDEIAYAIADKVDFKRLSTGILAARASATVAGHGGGSEITLANTVLTDVDVLLGGMFTAQKTLDEKNVPRGRRYCYLKPAQYYLFRDKLELISTDFGGQTDFAQGTVGMIAGASLVMTNNLPQEVVSAEGGDKNPYDGDFSLTAALYMESNAVSAIEGISPSIETQRITRELQDFVVAKHAQGCGIRRPDGAVLISKTS